MQNNTDKTPGLTIEIRYGNLWNARGRYNSASGNMENVTANPKVYNPRLAYEPMIEHAKARLMGCAKADPERNTRPVGFVPTESVIKQLNRNETIEEYRK
ncbi:MAG: hypothetical protein QT00_C0002G0183 [archaeon GW2011_AR5]|nr:MAG: hypothetical protein QT00_C0002G0183 [archaeon GW2011_AR5]